MSKGTSFNDYLREQLEDPEMALNFISEAVEENNPDYLKIAIGEVIKAYGVENIAHRTGITRQALYKMFSKTGNPTHKNLISVLNVLGLELTVKKKRTPTRSQSSAKR